MMKNGLLMTALLMSMVPSAMAAEPVEYTLDTLLVTATKYEEKDLNIPAMTNVFTQKDIERLGATNVMDLLANVPGAVITPPVGMGGTIGFRGLAKNTVNATILVDGIPLNSQGAANLETLDTDTISRVEVIKGAGAVLYGSDAMAGVINIITKENNSNKITAGFGKDGKRYGSLEVKAGNLDVNYSRDQIQKRGLLTRTLSTVGHKFAKDSLNLNYKVNDNIKLQYLYTNQLDEYDWLNKYTPAKTTFNKNTYDFHVLNLNYQNNDFYFNTYGRRHDFKGQTWVKQTNAFQSSSKNVVENFGAEMRNKWDIGNSKLTAGIVFDREEADYSSIKRNRNNTALYALSEIPLSEKLDLFLGTRYQMVEDLKNELCPQIQLLYKMDDTQSIYVNANKSFRVPTIKEQYNSNSNTFIPNPDLKPEKAWTYEIGWKKQFDDSSLKLGLYKLRVEDRIYSTKTGDKYNGDDIYTPINADKFENIGFEGLYEQRIDDNWYYNFGFAFSNPKQTTKSNVMKRVDFRNNVNALLGYKNRDFSSNLSVQHIWDRTPSYGTPAPQMWNLNFNMNYHINKNSDVKLLVNNLLDRDDWLSSGGSFTPNRNFVLYYSYKF